MNNIARRVWTFTMVRADFNCFLLDNSISWNSPHFPAGDSLFYSSNNYTLTPAQSLAKEVIELLKICPKATMNFSKFVPAYHNYFGKQCRVADYGYTKLIELFEGMSSIIQVSKRKA